MPKGMRNPREDYPLEGGGGGGMGGGGGGYKVAPRKSRNPDDEALETLAMGFGAPLIAGGIMAGVGKADRTMTEAGDEKRAQERREARNEIKRETRGKAKGGAVKMASGGKVSSASKRADGIAQRGKTKGKYL